MIRACIAFIFVCVAASAAAQTRPVQFGAGESSSRLRGVVERFREDFNSIDRFYSAPTSPKRFARLQKLYDDQLAGVAAISFSSLRYDEQVDFILFRNYLEREKSALSRRQSQLAELRPIIPFANAISDLEDSRRRLEPIDSAKAAGVLNNLEKTIRETQAGFKSAKIAMPKQTVANRAARTLASLRQTLASWYGFYNGYDPLFTWWNTAPYKAADEALKQYEKFVTEKLVRIAPDDKTTIIGDPIGHQALIDELKYEMIPYSPEELIEIANKEYAWSEAEMKKASREMGFGDDWKKALETIKQKYVEPGKQPELIKNLALEAIDFVESRNLVTVPPLAKESWRMEMMSPERQLVAPFFLGGEQILVAYPTSGMSHEQKLMSMRGNNPHFARATVFHELIPGHNLQQFMISRYRPYRDQFYTPFWMEGWALYWEFLLWDKGFQKSPEDRIGALFWRMHRAARIIFSLSFHLEKMTPQQAVDMLVERVGHERDNAAAEVRRSFSGDYAPLYQIAYMVGGLQFYRLRRELVDSNRMTDAEFHDAILRQGPIPVAMIRSILTKQKLTPDQPPTWRFY